MVIYEKEREYEEEGIEGVETRENSKEFGDGQSRGKSWSYPRIR